MIYVVDSWQMSHVERVLKQIWDRQLCIERQPDTPSELFRRNAGSV